MRIRSIDTAPQPSRRGFLKGSAAASFGALTFSGQAHGQTSAEPLPPAFSTLRPLGARVRPISPAEFSGRIRHAQELMSGVPSPAGAKASDTSRFDALFLAPGTSLYYFTGIHWGLSERLLGLIIPRTGNPILVVPGFEEGRMRERLRLPLEVRAWQEDESPTKLAAAPKNPRGLRNSSASPTTAPNHAEHITLSNSFLIGGKIPPTSHQRIPIPVE